MIVSSDLAETGEDGRLAQEALGRLAAERNVALLGSNAPGFITGVPPLVLER